MGLGFSITITLTLINKSEIADECSGVTGADLALCLEPMALSCQKFKPLAVLSVQICDLFLLFFYPYL